MPHTFYAFFKKEEWCSLFNTGKKSCKTFSRSALFFVNRNVREEYFIHAILIHATKSDTFSSTKKHGQQRFMGACWVHYVDP